MKKEIKTANAPEALGPYSQAVVSGGILFVSGQIALDAVTGEMVGDDVSGQTEKVFQNIKAILEAAGVSEEQVVKCSVFLKDMDDFAAMNKIYGSFFSQPYPARAAVQVAKLPKDAKIEIEVTALL